MFLTVCVRHKLSVMEILINIQHIRSFSLKSLYIECTEILQRQRKFACIHRCSKSHSDVDSHLRDSQQSSVAYDIYVVPNVRTLR